MSLLPGTRLGSYVVIAPLGAGGMGEVYRARDTRLGRDVALKVLPDDVAHDPVRLVRFAREARAVAALSHPNVLTVFDVGDGVHPFAAFELLSGQTLNLLLARPFAVSRAVDFAVQIARGLAAAHRMGIVHRDVTPGNLFVTDDGRVKILDFGIARMNALAAGAGCVSTLTLDGAVLGTAGYLAPEQARGEPTDARTDIFALGAVLYEMLTGQRAFSGASAADAVAAVLRDEPPAVTSLAPRVPPAVGHIVHRCLAVQPESRFQSAADVALALEAVMSSSAHAVAYPRRDQLRLVVAVSLAALVATATAWRWGVPSPRTAMGQPPRGISKRLLVELPESAPVGPNVYVPFSLSPDGRLLAYATPQPEHLMLRSLDADTAVELKGTDFAYDPFFSPDSSWAGYWAHGEIRKVPVTGGPSTVIGLSDDLLGAWWGDDGAIVYGPGHDGLYRVAANGGRAEPLTTLDRARGEIHHGFPQVLDGGRAVLFTVATSSSDIPFSIDLLDLTTGFRRRLVHGAQYGRFVASGHLVYVRDRVLMAVPFDPQSYALREPAVAVLTGVQDGPSGEALYSVARDGSLAYMAPRDPPALGLVWVTRQGATAATGLPTRPYTAPRLGPDGRRLVVNVSEGFATDVWTSIIGRTPLQRLTSARRTAFTFSTLAITADGRQVLYAEDTEHGARLVQHQIDQSTDRREVWSSTRPLSASRVLRDGTIVLNTLTAETGADILTLERHANVRPLPLVSAPRHQWGATLSPDEQFLAYVSNETGRYEVFVAPVTGAGPARQVTTDGGTEVVWRRDGRELFYRHDGRMMAVPVSTAPLTFGTPKVLFTDVFQPGPVGQPAYDVAPDGRFLMLQPVVAPARRDVRIVIDWQRELARLAP